MSELARKLEELASKGLLRPPTTSSKPSSNPAAKISEREKENIQRATQVSLIQPAEQKSSQPAKSSASLSLQELEWLSGSFPPSASSKEKAEMEQAMQASLKEISPSASSKEKSELEQALRESEEMEKRKREKREKQFPGVQFPKESFGDVKDLPNPVFKPSWWAGEAVGSGLGIVSGDDHKIIFRGVIVGRQTGSKIVEIFKQKFQQSDKISEDTAMPKSHNYVVINSQDHLLTITFKNVNELAVISLFNSSETAYFRLIPAV